MKARYFLVALSMAWLVRNYSAAQPERAQDSSCCPTGSSTSITCPSGTYLYIDSDGQGTCATCPARFYCPGGSSDPVPCPGGYLCKQGAAVGARNWTDATGGPCMAGYFCRNGTDTAVPCPETYYCPEQSESPLPCPPTFYCPYLTTEPVPCPAGFYCYGRNAEPAACPAGYYCLGSSAYPQPCPAGTYSPTPELNSSSQCIQCPANSCCPLASSSATSCSIETTDNSTSASTASSPNWTTALYDTVRLMCPPCDYALTTEAPSALDAQLEVRLKDMSLVDISHRNAKEVANEVQAATSNADNLTPLSVTYIYSIISKLARLTSSGNFTQDVYPVPIAIARMVGNLMNVKEANIAYAQGQSNVSIQASLEDSLYALAEAASKNDSFIGENLLMLQEENIAFQIVRNPSTRGLVISGDSSLSRASISPVYVNESAMTASGNATVIKLTPLVANNTKTFLVYKNVKLFRASGGYPRADNNSRVLSAQLPKGSSKTLAGLISVTFNGLTPLTNGTVRQCGYWNYSTESWSTNGCTATFIGAQDVECTCEHLTNFAALLAIENMPSDPALDIVSTIGLSLSAVSLAAAMATFIFIRKMRRTLSQKVLFNLALSLLLLDILFLLGIDSTHSKGGCIAVAVLLHYFLLTSFIWMLVESILQYLRFVKVLGTYIPKFMLKAAIPAWGAPAISVAIICGANPDLYFRGNNSYCLAKPEVVYYAVLLPIGLVLIVNWVVFAIVLKHICCRDRRFAYQQPGSGSRMAQLQAQAGVAICTILGLTWVFGFLTAIPDGTASLALQWLFCICNTLQGLFIFIFHCVREPTVLQEWKRICCTFGLSTQQMAASSTDDSTVISHSTSVKGSQVHSLALDTIKSIAGSLKPSHHGSFELQAVGEQK